MNSLSRFSTPTGLTETFAAMSARPGASFRAEVEELIERHARECAGTETVWMRFHLSDIANQAAELREILRKNSALVSMTGQPPADGARIALESWSLSSGPERRLTEESLELQLNHYRLFFFHKNALTSRGSEAQMREEFEAAEEFLRKSGGDIANHLHRTWIYCRDIDNNYAGLVEARRELFRGYGLTETSHYIASTGIEGLSDSPGRLVRMDSFALFGNRPEQIEYMHAPEYLSPTHLYGVTFERGTRIIYGDRSCYYISGTASIDRDGEIVHPGDAAAQAGRMAENVEALLTNHGGALTDLMQAVVYLRDPADREKVEAVLERRLPPECARITVRGAVCRPGWLVELDGIAVNRNGNPAFKEFN